MKKMWRAFTQSVVRMFTTVDHSLAAVEQLAITAREEATKFAEEARREREREVQQLIEAE